MKNKAGYIGIKEASKLAGVHPDTIRRLIKQHKGSKYVVRGKGDKAPYFISSAWLMDLYSLNEPHTAPTTGDNQKDDTEPTTDTTKGMSGLYEARIADLQQQIAEQNKTITELLTQHKDLISQQQQLQDQLKFILLPATTTQPQAYEANIQEVPVTDPAPQETKKAKKPQSKLKKTSKKKPKADQTPKVVVPKKRWWKRSK